MVAWVSKNSDKNPMYNIVAVLAVIVVVVAIVIVIVVVIYIIVIIFIVIVIIVINVIYADFFSSATIWSSMLKGDVCGLER